MTPSDSVCEGRGIYPPYQLTSKPHPIAWHKSHHHVPTRSKFSAASLSSWVHVRSSSFAKTVTLYEKPTCCAICSRISCRFPGIWELLSCLCSVPAWAYFPSKEETKSPDAFVSISPCKHDWALARYRSHQYGRDDASKCIVASPCSSRHILFLRSRCWS